MVLENPWNVPEFSLGRQCTNPAIQEFLNFVKCYRPAIVLLKTCNVIMKELFSDFWTQISCNERENKTYRWLTGISISPDNFFRNTSGLMLPTRTHMVSSHCLRSAKQQLFTCTLFVHFFAVVARLRRGGHLEHKTRRNARAELLFCQSKPIAFLTFLLPSPSSLFLTRSPQISQIESERRGRIYLPQWIHFVWL